MNLKNFFKFFRFLAISLIKKSTGVGFFDKKTARRDFFDKDTPGVKFFVIKSPGVGFFDKNHAWVWGGRRRGYAAR